MENYYLVCFDRKTGKIDICLEAMGKALLKLWALQNTTASKDTIVFEKDTGIVDTYYTGTKDFPKIEENAGNIEDYCPGFLKAMQKEETKQSAKMDVNKIPLDEQLKEVKEKEGISQKRQLQKDDRNLFL